MYSDTARIGNSGASSFIGLVEDEFAVHPTTAADVFGFDCNLLIQEDQEVHLTSTDVHHLKEFRVQIKTSSVNGWPAVSLSVLKHLFSIQHPCFLVSVFKARKKVESITVFYLGKDVIEWGMGEIFKAVKAAVPLNSKTVELPEKSFKKFTIEDIYEDGFSWHKLFTEFSKDFDAPYGESKKDWANTCGTIQDYKINIPDALTHELMVKRSVKVSNNILTLRTMRFGKELDTWADEGGVLRLSPTCHGTVEITALLRKKVVFDVALYINKSPLTGKNNFHCVGDGFTFKFGDFDPELSLSEEGISDVAKLVNVKNALELSSHGATALIKSPCFNMDMPWEKLNYRLIDVQFIRVLEEVWKIARDAYPRIKFKMKRRNLVKMASANIVLVGVLTKKDCPFLLRDQAFVEGRYGVILKGKLSGIDVVALYHVVATRRDTENVVLRLDGDHPADFLASDKKKEVIQFEKHLRENYRIFGHGAAIFTDYFELLEVDVTKGDENHHA